MVSFKDGIAGIAICLTHENRAGGNFRKCHIDQRTLTSKAVPFQRATASHNSVHNLRSLLGKTAYFGILTRVNHELEGGGVLSERKKAFMTQERTP